MQRDSEDLLFRHSVLDPCRQGYRSVLSSDPVRWLISALGCVAETLSMVGRPEFYSSVASNLCPLFGCNRFLVMSYGRGSKPEFLYNRSFPQRTAQLYLDTLYQHDPIYRAVQGGVVGGVLTLYSMRNGSRLSRYRNALSQHALISDELALMLPASDVRSVALCFNHKAGCFDEGIVKLAKAVYPTLWEANRLHIRQSSNVESAPGRSADSRICANGLPVSGRPEHFELLCRSRYLSTRERELLELTLDGLANRSIADRLSLALGTVKNYKRRLYRKVGVSSEREMLKMVANFLPAGRAA